jgi:hypothetical protein
MLYSSLPAGPTLASSVELRFADLARDLVRVLCAAEAEANDDDEPVTSECGLFRALARDGGGEAGLFLQKCGLKWHPRHDSRHGWET